MEPTGQADRQPPTTTDRSPRAPRAPRRRILINPPFQWRYATLVASVAFTVMLVLLVFLVWFFGQAMQANMVDQPSMPRYLTLAYGSVGFIVVVAMILVAWSLLETHRISGPVFILTRYLNTLAGGRIPQLRPLRKSDELQDLFATFSRAIADLRKRKQTELEELTAALDLARSAAADPDEDARKTALENLSRRLEQWRANVSHALDLDES